MTLRHAVRLICLFGCLMGAVGLRAQMHAHAANLHPEHDPHDVTVSDLNYPLDLTADWLVKQGDDPRYAAPGLDDSAWTVVDVKKPLSSIGWVQPNIVWYRVHVHIPAGEHGLGLLLRAFSGQSRVT